ncbi:hypothetical protein [Nostoc sp. C110]|uniref:hypothetical protein n=1 Tax=Nostoc sp. C110 TaxID=3349876 RepID=UPI00370D7AD1
MVSSFSWLNLNLLKSIKNITDESMEIVKAKDAMNRRLYKRPIIVETAIYRVFGSNKSS